MTLRSVFIFCALVTAAVCLGMLGFNTTNSATNAGHEPAVIKTSEKNATRWSDPPTKMAMPYGTNTQDKRWQMVSAIKRPLLLGNGAQFSMQTYPVLAEVNAGLLQELRQEPLVGRVTVFLPQVAKPVRIIPGFTHVANAAPRGE